MKLGSLFLIVFVAAGCDKNQNEQQLNHPKPAATPLARESVPGQQERHTQIRSNLEFTAFARAINLFNAREYAQARFQFVEFIRNYPLSTRIPVVQQRIMDLDQILAVEKQQADARERTRAAALAQAQEKGRLQAQAQSQAQAQNQGTGSGYGPLTTGTVTGTGSTRGDAYAAARQRLPSGATELNSTYSSGRIAGQGGTPMGYRCKITYQTK